ncbi:MAG: AbrB/MazE/SpoVT family DNA-binding domain-containing protein [Deltaproteobacteria bacterium]|nr:AbrB/MazE/SpoVT family DNA-binding domain-containing protein [Deltaproteobacteria bacterium]
MRITSKGQITIPVAIREALGLLPGVEVEFEVDGNTVRIVRNADAVEGRGRRVIDRIRGRATVKMTTDEIMALTRK